MTTRIAPTAPDLTHSIADKIVLIENAIVIPPAKGLGNQAIIKSGVLTAAGDPVENAITWRGPNRVTLDPEMPPEDEIQYLPGTHMFLGPLFGHFGHFLVESICRIWAFEPLRDKIDGVIYVPKFQNRPEYVAKMFGPFLDALGVTCPMINTDVPIRVEKLYVPQQGFGMFQMIEGAPEFRDFIKKYSGKKVKAKGDKRIYISRSALPPARGSVVGEGMIEKRLIAEGYEVYHPQKHSFIEQIAAYKAAKDIIAVDCSPLHLLALVGNSKQKIGILARRNGDLDKIFAQQIRAMTGATAEGINHLKYNWIDSISNRPSRTSWGEVDHAAVSKSLKDMGLISGKLWPKTRADKLVKEIERIGTAAKTTFRRFED